jgi:hypothetical protein
MSAIATVMPHARGTGPFVLVMGTEHADIIGRKNGWSKDQVKEYLFEKTRRPATRDTRSRNIRTVDGREYVYMVRVPGDLLIVVAGGGNGGLTAVIPTWVYSVPPGDFVTREVKGRVVPT